MWPLDPWQHWGEEVKQILTEERREQGQSGKDRKRRVQGQDWGEPGDFFGGVFLSPDRPEERPAPPGDDPQPLLSARLIHTDLTYPCDDVCVRQGLSVCVHSHDCLHKDIHMHPCTLKREKKEGDFCFCCLCALGLSDGAKCLFLCVFL